MGEKEHPPYCLKEKEISTLQAEMKMIKKVVMDGNGEPAIIYQLPRLNNNVELLNEQVPALAKAVGDLGDFRDDLVLKQKLQSEEEQRKQAEKDRKERKTRYIIGTALTIIGLLSGILLALLVG